MEEKQTEHQIIRSYIQGIVTGILMVLLAAGVWWFIVHPTVFFSDVSSENGLNHAQMESVLKKANQIIDHIQKEYILEDIPNEALIEGMYGGIMDILNDKYAAYYTKEEYAQVKKHTEGVYGGIGVSVNDELEIVRVYQNSPAEQANIEAGDRLVRINGVLTETMTKQERDSAMAGQLGDVKKLELYRPSAGTTYEVEVTLAEVETPTVFWRMMEDGVVYLQITAFENVTQEQFEKAWAEITSTGEMKGLILDLRNNLGGGLNPVMKVANALVPEGLVSYTEDKQGNRQEFRSEGTGAGVPMVVLVNEKSASASELLAGALKERGAAQLVGTTTYGKGIVQTTWSLSDGTAFKMTTAKYYTPDGHNIQGTGIEPDIFIDLTAEQKAMTEIPEDEDMQLQTALELVRTRLGK